jgi:hypothetical protein
MKTFMIAVFIAALLSNAASAGLAPIGLPDVPFTVAKKNVIESKGSQTPAKKLKAQKRGHRSNVRIASR